MPEGKAVLGVSGVLVPPGREPLNAFLALAETLRSKGEAIKHKNACFFAGGDCLAPPR